MQYTYLIPLLWGMKLEVGLLALLYCCKLFWMQLLKFVHFFQYTETTLWESREKTNKLEIIEQLNVSCMFSSEIV